MHTNFVVVENTTNCMFNRKYKEKVKRFVALIHLLELIMEDIRIKSLIDESPALVNRFEQLKARKVRWQQECERMCA